jgi:hypothetical protein
MSPRWRCAAARGSTWRPPSWQSCLAAELHDVGKLAIPDVVLPKTGPLDPTEWGFIHSHTLIGQRILGAAPALLPVGAIVRATHENWDGSGYPDETRGRRLRKTKGRDHSRPFVVSYVTSRA